jgi:carbon-monoxide dehydrogenase large subunit
MDSGGPMPTAWVPPGRHSQHARALADRQRHRQPRRRSRSPPVVGLDRYAVVDAAEDVLVDYDPLPVGHDLEEALKDEVVIHEALGTNKSHEWSLGGGDIEAGFNEADGHRRAAGIVNHRISGRRDRAARRASPRSAPAASRSGARRRSRTSCATSWPRCSA